MPEDMIIGTNAFPFLDIKIEIPYLWENDGISIDELEIPIDYRSSEVIYHSNEDHELLKSKIKH